MDESSATPPLEPRLADVLGSAACLVSAASSMADAAAMLATTEHGLAVAIDGGGRPVGVVTQRALLRALVAGHAPDAALAVALEPAEPQLAPDAALEEVLAHLQRTGGAVAVAVAPDGRALGVVPRELVVHYAQRLEILRREHDFRALAENSPDNILRYDRSCRRVYANARALSVVRAPPTGEALGVTPDEAHPEGTFRAYQRTLERVLASGQAEDCEVRTFDGTRDVYHIVRVAPERDALGRVSGVVSFGRDVTPLREGAARLEAALAAAQSAERATNAFLGNLSHELRTPLNGVLAVADLLRTTALTGEQYAQVQTIAHSGEVLLALLNNLLEYAAIEAGHVTVTASAFSLAALLQRVAAVAGPQARERGLSFELRGSAELPPLVFGDERRLEQILLNLVDNALKFTDEGGITVVARSAAGRARFEVRDSGIGIAAADQLRLFTAFGRLEAARLRQTSGTGIGLVICKSLVTAMGGTLGLESAPGRGSTFWFEALLPERSSAIQVAPKPVGSPRFEGEVLLAEDNPVNARVQSSLLEKLGFQVTLALDGREAVATFPRRPYALVLLDLHMPTMGGEEAARAIRALETPPHRTPILALSAGATPMDRPRCLGAGMDEVLSKPLRVDALVEVLRQWVPRCECAAAGMT